MASSHDHGAPNDFADDDSKTRADGQRVFTTAQHDLGFDVRLVHDSREPWRSIELWTARSVYWLDQDRTCIAVISRETGAVDASHQFLGARLVGGQQRSEHGVSVAQPLPIPGMSAVFRLKSGFSKTSAVEQIVVQVKIDNVAPDGPEPDWANLPELLGR